MFWKVDQSLEVSTPLFVALADGRLKVMVLPAPVTVKSEPTVEVAKVTAGPVVVCPTGPSDVSAAVKPWVKQVPLYARHPLRRLIPFEAEVVAVPKVSAPTIVVDALIVEDALETKPLENVSVVVVALLGKR